MGAKELPNDKTGYLEKEIEFSIKDLTLSGTLTLPKKERNPCAILLSGYGSTARDNTTGDFPRYKVLAEQLATNGFASFRFDDRGSGKSSKVNWHDYTFDDLADEALVAFDLVKNNKKITAEKIGFIGHSLGATTGLLAASKNKEVAFVVAAAPHGMIGVDTAINTRNAIARNADESQEEITQWSGTLRDILIGLQNKNTSKESLSKLKQALYDKYQRNISEEKRKELSFETFLQSTYEGFVLALGDTNMYRSFLNFNPWNAYNQLACHTLLVYAGNDLLHPSEIHKPTIETIFKENIGSKMDVLEFKNANHDFTIKENQKVIGFVDSFCELIINWIRGSLEIM
ncbi:MAG: alpha/beta hydrolase [Asgard group archaeon]|nr:alpha/beta hydrolase [Asgard group archaeon]